MLSDDLAVQEHLPRPRKSVGQEEDLLVGEGLDVGERLKCFTDFVAGVKQDPVAVEDEKVVLLNQISKVSLLDRRSRFYVVLDGVALSDGLVNLRSDHAASFGYRFQHFKMLTR